MLERIEGSRSRYSNRSLLLKLQEPFPTVILEGRCP